MTTTPATATRFQRGCRPTAALVVTFMLALAWGPTAAVGSHQAAGDIAPASPLTDFVASLEGGWVGTDNDTPFGRMPFGLLFEWTEDGGLHARSPLNRDTYIELRFEEAADGSWTLHEEAAMEGLGVQNYSLISAPNAGETGVHRWIWEQDPQFLAIDIELEGETMNLNVLLRGQPHVAFRLDKQPRESWAEMKRQMLAQAERSPSEGTSILEVVSDPPDHLGSAGDDQSGAAPPDDPIELARRSVIDAPEDAQAHLALARLLSTAINESPGNGPRYAFEMLSALQSAVALDNQLAEAYHYLVGYYLNAPPIAGGSIEKAEETARSLAEFDPIGGRQLMSQVAAHREGRTSDESRR